MNALTVLDSLESKIRLDIESIDDQFTHEENYEIFQYLKGRKVQCRLMLDYIDELRAKANEKAVS